MSLADYNKKRNFKITSEPEGKLKNKKKCRFVIHKHNATHLHYDLRFEIDGVLKSWAVPKGPSLDPNIKRLATQVEDHPASYIDFEGLIPQNQYGAGATMVWDTGDFSQYQNYDIKKGLEKGDCKFILHGGKLKGAFVLVKIKKSKNDWLLIKKKDEFTTTTDVLRFDLSAKTGRDMDEITSGDTSSKNTKHKNALEKKLAAIKNTLMPKSFSPMLISEKEKPFDDEAWIFEPKLDGYRCIAFLKKNIIKLVSRNGLLLNDRFPNIVSSLRGLRKKQNIILDGEIVGINKNGITKFDMLEDQEKVRFFIFDILYLDGKLLTQVPLSLRKKILSEKIENNHEIKIVDYIFKNGVDFFEVAKKVGLEGIVGKKLNSVYQEGIRSDAWVKIKPHKSRDILICGYIYEKSQLKSLVMGDYIDKKLNFIGHVNAKFSGIHQKYLLQHFVPITTTQSPFSENIETNGKVFWLRPKLVAEVKYLEITPQGKLRHPVFMRLRQDKSISDLVAQPETNSLTVGQKLKLLSSDERTLDGGSDLKLTHLSKTYFKKNNIKKSDILNYYNKISAIILPHLADRPQNLFRTMDGEKHEGFYQKNFEGGPKWLKTISIYSQESHKSIRHLLCQNKETLLYMANLGCVEINPWLSKVENIKNPNLLVLDLDPLNCAFSQVVKTALVTKGLLDGLNIVSYVKTSGKTGLHIFIPLNAKYDFEKSRLFAQLLATKIYQKIPNITSIERNPQDRIGKVYIDFLQNRFGQTIASAYSIRPTKDASVSTPLLWSEVNNKLDPKKFNITNTLYRVDKIGDLWKDMLNAKGVDIYKVLDLLQS